MENPCKQSASIPRDKAECPFHVPLCPMAKTNENHGTLAQHLPTSACAKWPYCDPCRTELYKSARRSEKFGDTWVIERAGMA
eukprot:5608799-Amphidinium_carterae.2